MSIVTSAPIAAVAIVRARGARESVLLIKRSERKEDSWSGHWSFPGGRRDPDDRDLLQTALRELEEECGIRLYPEHMEAELPPAIARRRTGPFVLVAPYVFDVKAELPSVLDPEEAVDAVWMPLSVFCDPACHSFRAVPGLPANWLFPAVDLKGVPLWGFTYRLAAEWLGLLAEQHPIEEAGSELARRVLDFLLAKGLALMRTWEDRPAQPGSTERQTVKLAKVEGAIPVEQVIAHFSEPGTRFPGGNLLEVRPDAVRVVGLAFEEYLISTVG